MGAIALDASVLIGLLDPSDAHHRAAVELLEPRADRPVIVSAVAYSESLVAPTAKGEAWRVDAMLADAGARIVAVDAVIARRAAVLRAAHSGLRLPDAMTLATAILGDAELLTFDQRLARIAQEQP